MTEEELGILRMSYTILHMKWSELSQKTEHAYKALKEVEDKLEDAKYDMERKQKDG